MPEFLKKSAKNVIKGEPWKVLVVDDEPDVHAITSVIARDIVFLNRPVRIYSAYSEKEAKEILTSTPDMALAMIDVVMEKDSSGLELVQFIREEMNNNRIRLVIRTGQPGFAPPREIISKYDINDYREKAELSSGALFTLIVAKLREYNDFVILDKQRLLLSKLGSLTSMFINLGPEVNIVNLVDEIFNSVSKILDVEIRTVHTVIDKEEYIRSKKTSWSNSAENVGDELSFSVRTSLNDYIKFNVHFSSILDESFEKILDVFISEFVTRVENDVISKDLVESLYKVVYIISEVTEARSLETGEHVRRVGTATKILAEDLGINDEELPLLEIAAMLHDVGKIGIPDSILLKPSRLSDEEFEIMKQHTSIGYNILSTVDHPLFRMASLVALYHHENWDGSGYPKGLKGEDIPLYARIVGLMDVYDALLSDRIYRPAWDEEAVLKYIKENTGKKFDPKIVEIFERNYDKIRTLYFLGF